MKPEDALQIACAEYLNTKYPGVLWWHTPNGGSRNAIEAKKLKRMGVKRGVPDIFIAVKRGHLYVFHDKPTLIMKNGFFCELKVRPNKLTKEQSEMLAALALAGYYCCVCYSIDEFMKEVEAYLG